MKAKDLHPLSDITVYVDMDGVIVDTYTHIGNIIGVPHYDHIKPEQWEKFYSEVDAEDLFATLGEFPTTNKLLDIVIQYAGRYVLLSSPLNYDVEGSIRGKKRWLADRPNVNSDNAIFDSAKEKYAVSNGKPNVLIDDSPSNIRKWEAAGGIAIKYIGDKDSLSTIVAGLKNAATIINNDMGR